MCDRGIDTSAAAMRHHGPTNGSFPQDSLHAQHGQDRDTEAYRPDSTAPTQALSAHPSFSSPQPQPHVLCRQPSTAARKEGHEFLLLLPICWESAPSISTHPDHPEPAAQPCPATAPGTQGSCPPRAQVTTNHAERKPTFARICISFESPEMWAGCCFHYCLHVLGMDFPPLSPSPSLTANLPSQLQPLQLL